MNKIERLDWDSNFFGYEVGKIEIVNFDDFDINDFLEQTKSFRLTYIFSKLELKTTKLKLVDQKVILSQKIDDSKLVESEDDFFHSFDIKKHDYNQLKKLALESGVYSRYFIDNEFKKNEYQNLYSCWIENSVNKKLAFDIVIATRKEEILGFTTLTKKGNIADIGLVAVSNKHRGLGIGKKLIIESITRARNAKFKEIQVVTQLNNIAAIKLYKAANFKIKETINIYHLWNK